MNKTPELQQQVMAAARDNGVSSVLFRNAIGRKLGLSVTDAECLSFLAIKGVSTPTELARYTGLTTGSTTALLDRLEKVGFISRTPNPNDRRGVVVKINTLYTEAATPLVMGVQKAHHKLLESYSDKELLIIIDFLTRFTNNVKESTDTINK